MANKKTKEIDLRGDFGAVAFKMDGLCVEISADRKSVNVVSVTPVHVTRRTPHTTDIAAAWRALDVGQRMKDGTVVISVDLDHNLAYFAPEGIFGGKSDFDHQEDVAKAACTQRLHGYSDWQTIPHSVAVDLARDWNKVASPALRDSDVPSFWSGALHDKNTGRAYGGIMGEWCRGVYRYISLPVPVVRGGSAHGSLGSQV